MFSHSNKKFQSSCSGVSFYNTVSEQAGNVHDSTKEIGCPLCCLNQVWTRILEKLDRVRTHGPVSMELWYIHTVAWCFVTHGALFANHIRTSGVGEQGRLSFEDQLVMLKNDKQTRLQAATVLFCHVKLSYVVTNHVLLLHWKYQLFWTLFEVHWGFQNQLEKMLKCREHISSPACMH